MRVNGDVRNPAALAVAPGHDGVSLREAVLAVNAVPGPHDVVFDPTLSGAVIHLRGEPLQLTTAGTSIAGFLLPDGSPAISIEGSGAIWPGNSGLAPAVLYVKRTSSITPATPRFST